MRDADGRQLIGLGLLFLGVGDDGELARGRDKVVFLIEGRNTLLRDLQEVERSKKRNFSLAISWREILDYLSSSFFFIFKIGLLSDYKVYN
jgi:hypothetical protein